MRIVFQNILPPQSVLRDMVRQWIREDVPSFDVGAAVAGDRIVEATLFYKPRCEDAEGGYCVIAGTVFADLILQECGCGSAQWMFQDGDVVAASEKKQGTAESDANDDTILRTEIRLPVARLRGPARQILQAERLALNVLSRCSSIATIAHRFRKIKDQNGFKGEIAATRKSTPGFRLVEKYGVIVGGCSPHRFDVSQMVMLKDNHIDAFHGNIEDMVSHTKKLCGFSTMIEVECRSLDDAIRAASAGAHVVMLDNFSPQATKDAARHLKQQFPNVIIETSGGLTLDNASTFFDENIDVLSTSQLLYGHGDQPVDFSLKFDVSEA